MAPVTEPAPGDDAPQTTPLDLPPAPVGLDRVRPFMVAATAVSALALGVAALVNFPLVLGTTVALALVLAATWPSLVGAAAPRTTSVVLGVSGVAIVVTAMGDGLRWLAAAVAAGILASFLHQLTRRPRRKRLVLSLLAAFSALALVASGTTLAAVMQESGTAGFVVVGTAAVVLALSADLLVTVRGARPLLSLVALVVGVLGALLVATGFDAVEPLMAAGLGAAGAVVSWSMRQILSHQPAILSRRGQVAAGVASVLSVGGIVHLFALTAQ